MEENNVSDRELVLYSQQNEIAIITINRTDVRNALNPDVLSQLSFTLDRVKSENCVKAVIITGSGETFSAGADIRFLYQASPMEVRNLARLAVEVNHKIETLGKVVVAAINGYALGGGLELAEACTLRVSVKNARLGHPEVQIGAIAGFGGTTRLPRLNLIS